ncbi:HNH endonuclease [Patescibacteria group bacterium]|jgi:hypothetical protein|nr:HNH endonuclease [Patescibacteria group bacterium]
MKCCTKCNITKPSLEFHKRSKAIDGLDYWCKKCKHEYQLGYYGINKESIRKRNTEWEKDNKEKCKAASKMWRDANREKVRAYQKKYVEANREKAYAASKAWEERNQERKRRVAAEWRAANIELCRAYWHSYYGRKMDAKGSHTAEEVVALYKFQKGRCAACKGKLGSGYHKDHIVPLKPREGGQKGTNYISNIQLLCQRCNNRKCNKDPIQFMQEMGYLL